MYRMAMPAQAQLHFGVKGGLNLSKASFSDVKENFKRIPSLHVTIPLSLRRVSQSVTKSEAYPPVLNSPSSAIIFL